MMSAPDNLTCPPLFDLLELEEEPALLPNQIQPLIEPSPDECMRHSTTHPSSDVALHTFPDPVPLQQPYLPREVPYRPEDPLPIWSLESFCESSPLQTHSQPSDTHSDPQWHSEEMEIQHEDVPQIIVESPNLQVINTYLQPSSPIALSLPCTAEPTLTIPAEYTPWTLPVLYYPSLPTSVQNSPCSPSIQSSPFSPFASSLNSSTELGLDTSSCSPYASTMESEPEFYEGFEPEPGIFAEPALDLDLALQPELHTQEFAEPLSVDNQPGALYTQGVHHAQELHSAQVLHSAQELHNAQDLCNAQSAYNPRDGYNVLDVHSVQEVLNEMELYSQLPFFETCATQYSTSAQQEFIPHNMPFACENGHDGNHDEQYYLGDCEGVAEAYSSLVSSTDGETYCAEPTIENYSGFAEVEDAFVPSNIGECESYLIPQATEHPPRADIHQVLLELNAMKPSLQSIPGRKQKDYAQYHNTLAKLGRGNTPERREALRQAQREDIRRLLGVSQLSIPTKVTEISKPAARTPVSSDVLACARANLRRVPTIDSDTVTKLININRKTKRNVEMESKNPLDTFIRGSKVIRLTHSYQQIVFKPDPIPKKRKTKREVIEHIHQQIPEFSNVPPPPPKPTPKKPNKEFWKHLEF